MFLRKILLPTLTAMSLVAVATSGFARPLPPGNYWKSCNSCSYNRHNILRCNCLTRSGFNQLTKLHVGSNCATVQNNNGNLMCTRHYRRPARRPAPRPVMKKDFNAGPIYSQHQAVHVCPRVCDHTAHFPRWTGQWHTVSYGRNSVCLCRR